MEGKGRSSALYLAIALTASTALAIAIAYLEVRRDREIHGLNVVIEFLVQDVERLRVELNKIRNESSTALTRVEQLENDLKSDEDANKTEGESSDTVDYYYGDYDEENEESDDDTARKKRNVPLLYLPNNQNSILSETYKTTKNKSRSEVQAEIIVESPLVAHTGGEEEFISPQKNACCHTFAAHFGGDSSFARTRHPMRYDGNHRMYHHEGNIREWSPAQWVPDLFMDTTFSLQDGVVTLSDAPGIYYFYAQIFYADTHDVSGYKVLINGQPVMQCTVTSLTHQESRGRMRHSEVKRNSCHTGGLVRLERNDRISIKEVEGDRYTIFEPTKSFFGLFRVSSFEHSR